LPHFGSVPSASFWFDRKVSVISNASKRMAETVELLERVFNALCVVTAIVILACMTAFLAALTFAVIHNGNDFDFVQRSAGVAVHSDGT